MKKILPAFALIMLLISLASCSLESPAAPAADSENAALISASLLAGYPQDAVPLYQPDALMSCGFSYRENDSYDIGKDIYTVTFESTADQKSLIAYYSALLTEQEEFPSVEGDVITDQLNGKIGNYQVELMFLDNQDSTVTVYLTLGLPVNEYVADNPYFADYPTGLVDEYGVSAMQEVTYQQQYYGAKTTHYITIYRTGLSAADFSARYGGAYASKQGFAWSDSDQSACAWQDGDFSVSVRYSDGDMPYITLDVSKAG